MENKSYAFWTGLFTLSLLGALGLVWLWLTRDQIEQVPYDLIARTYVTGLSPDARVRYRWLTVGKVEHIRLDPQQPGRIVVRMKVNRDVPMTRSTFATLNIWGVTGIGFIQLDDTGTDPRPLRSSAQHVAQLELQPGLLEQLQRNGPVLLQQLQQTIVNLNRLLGDETHAQLLASLRSAQHAANGIASLSQGARPVLDQLPGTLNTLNQTLKLTHQLAAGLNDPHGPLVTNLNRIGMAAQQINETVQEVAARVSYDTLPQIASFAHDVRTAARSFYRATDTFTDNPRSLLFGSPRAVPGPGEPGFSWSAATLPSN